MNYHLVYDVILSDYHISRFILRPLIMIGIVLFGLLLNRKYRTRKYRGKRFIPRFCILVGTFLILELLRHSWGEYLMLSSALLLKRYDVVAGKVTQFVPAAPGSNGHDSFMVDGHRFSYSNADHTSAFHQTRIHGSPIHNGLQVRIADVHGKIARLEIAEKP